MFFVFFTEIFDRCKNRIWRAFAESAERASLLSSELLKFLYITFFAFAGCYLLKYLQHLIGAYPAGRTFSAGFGLGKGKEKLCNVHHAVVFIHDDHSAGTHDGTDLGRESKSTGRSRYCSGIQPPEGPPVCTALNFLIADDTAADIKDYLPQGYPHRHFNKSRILDFAGKGKNLGAGRRCGSYPQKPVRAFFNNRRNTRISFDIIQVAG